MMTAQEIFDTVVQHLYDQGGPAKNTDDMCMYRAVGNRKCAFGILIPDEEYDPYMEHKPVRSIINYYFVFQKLYADQVDLIEALQIAHDRGISNHKIEWTDVYAGEGESKYKHRGIAYQLIEVAKKFGLSYENVELRWPRS